MMSVALGPAKAAPHWRGAVSALCLVNKASHSTAEEIMAVSEETRVGAFRVVRTGVSNL